MIHVLMKIAYYGFVQIRHIERKSQHQSIDRLQLQKMLRNSELSTHMHTFRHKGYS